ncbi:MAG: DUF433 domain-containing protein [Dehalococcoidia bacterium]|nr:DUF433 domain-containing protein [Dehalococcoidia bacterium]
MKLEDYFEFVGPDVIRLKGHRIGIEHVLAYYREGYSPEAIAQEFPGLDLEMIYATITYYLGNRTDLDSYLARLDEHSQQEYRAWSANPTPLVQRLRDLTVQCTRGQRA